MIDITLYGKPSSVYQYLKLHVQSFTEKAGIDISLKEIHDTNAFIQESILSIPAVKLGEQIKSIDDQNINSFINEVNEWIFKNVDQNNLMTLNVPVDFSDTSTNAVKYAKELSKQLNGKVNLIHCYYPTPVSINEVSFIDPELETIRRKSFDEYTSQVSSDAYLIDPKSPIIEKEFVLGFPGQELVNISKRSPDDMMVIGSSGGGAMKKYFGSVSTEIVQKGGCPVLVVPSDAKYNPLRKITLCSNDVELDAASIDEVIKIAAPYNAEIEVLHIDEGKGYQETLLMNLIINRYPKNKVGFTLIQGDSKAKAIESYTKSEKPDLLVFSKKSKNLLRELFHKSLTKQLLLTSTIPFLIIHK